MYKQPHALWPGGRGRIKFPTLLFYLKSPTELNKERTWQLLSPGAAFSGESSCPASCPDGSPCLTAGLGLHHGQGNGWMWAGECGGGVSGNDAQEQLSNQPRYPGPLSRSPLSTQEGTRQSSPHRIPLFSETDCPQTVWQALGAHICHPMPHRRGSL